jgi:hypothetical protein
MLLPMTKELSARILVGLSVLYGLLIAVLAVMDVAVGPTAIVGALVLGALWIARGMFIRERRL